MLNLFKKWWFWTAIVIIIFAIASAGEEETTPAAGSNVQEEETSAPAQAESKPEPAVEKQWTEIVSWDGQGIKKTETFTTTQKEWRVSWKTTNENVAGILQIMVYDEDGNMQDIVANAQGENEDSSVFRGDPGNYYLDINSANVDWEIKVEEKR
jgi:hypothetical protein